ncbi:gamma-interferon-inducible lysosomal thiol reductase [Hoplias malabaricus]|uniref:gamma-interferon-inducible lysosomal thiol reductase n=1 Tax=Hoplias malabaricus TaxID=27720 RepID=UPI003463227A
MNSFLNFVILFFITERCEGMAHPKPSCGYPPSQWCRTLEIAVECGVRKQCMELFVTRPDPSVSPVDLIVYYESLCPGCRSFLTEQLFPTWTMLRDIMRVHLVPYGNAEVRKQCMELFVTRPDPSVSPVDLIVYYESLCPGCRSFLTEQLFPTWTMLRDIMRVHLVPYGNAEDLPEQNSFLCQHGELECRANMIETCVLNVTDHAALSVIHCMVSSSDVIKSAPSCLQLYAPHVEWRSIESCTIGNLGHSLMRENGVKTQSLRPVLTHVPWVTFNGVYTEDWADTAMSSLFNLVCKLYEGIKPPVCTGALKKLNRSFC